MGITLKNIITDYRSEEDLMFLEAFETSFQFVQAKQFHAQFHGIIGQINETQIEHNSYRDDAFLKNHHCQDLDEAFDIIYQFEDQVKEFSKQFPSKLFAYVEVDCFGGACAYEGFIIKNGAIEYQQKPTNDGHIRLLEKLNPNFKEWYFEPFTRDFFTKKGIIKGHIQDFSLAGLWVALKTDYPDTEKYYVDAGANELILRCHHQYQYYFVSSADRHITISGIIYNDDDEMVEEIASVPDNSFQGMTYELEIHLLDKDKVIQKTSLK